SLGSSRRWSVGCGALRTRTLLSLRRRPPRPSGLRVPLRRERLRTSMRGRLMLIAVASVAVVTAPPLDGATGNPSGQPPAEAAAGGPSATGLPTGCTHGGGRFHRHGPVSPKRIAIGFDDGPGDYTPKVLRVLREYDSHATFFEIGQEVPGHEAVMKRVL